MHGLLLCGQTAESWGVYCSQKNEMPSATEIMSFAWGFATFKPVSLRSLVDTDMMSNKVSLNDLESFLLALLCAFGKHTEECVSSLL